MLRPWVVRAGDGRLATTRRPFRFVARLSAAREFLILSNMKPLHVVVIGQNDSQRNDLLGLLRGAGHQVVAASTPSFAADAIAAEFDTMVVDLTWPGLDLPSLRRALSRADDGEPDSLAAVERRHLALVLRHTSGNKRKAAHLLGISRSTLLNKVRKYHLEGAESSR